nr:ATP-binding protein [Tissierella sp.]
MLKDNRVKIVIGHYGSGKTEFSINYAVKLAKLDKKVTLVDLDIVNLYFRSREKASMLESLGISLIGSSIKASSLDLPAVSPAVAAVFSDQSSEAILDIGGDPAGARTLGRYKEQLKDGNYDMFFVLNRYRKETDTVDKAISYIREIEKVSRAKVTGIVSNAHFLKSTTIEDILDGTLLSQEVSQKTGIPLKYITVLKELEEDLKAELPEELQEKIFPIELYMREEWMV